MVMIETSKKIVNDIAGKLGPLGLTLTREEGEAIMERFRANVMGAVHDGFIRIERKEHDEGTAKNPTA
jgi:hypothetical protein